MAPGRWRIRIYEKDRPSRGIHAWLGSTVPTPSGGGGGHEARVRPRREPVLVWAGRPSLMVQSVEIILGGFSDHPAAGVDGGVPVMAARQTLVNMFRPDDPEDEPPVVKVDTRGDAVMFQQLNYVITNLEWGDAEADAEMNRVQQTVTVELTEYRPDELLRAQHGKRRRKGGRGRSKGPRSYTVKAGDTLSSIAVRLKVKGGWRAIAEIQKPPIHDPRSLRVGQKLRLP